MLPLSKLIQNSKFFHIAHRRTSLTHDTKSMHHSHICLKSHVFVSIFTKRMVRSAEDLMTIEKMAAAGMGNKKIKEALGVPAVDTQLRSPHGTLV